MHLHMVLSVIGEVVTGSLSLRSLSVFPSLLSLSPSLPPSFSLQITPAILKQLLEKIREDMQGLEGGEEAAQIQKHFENTLQHIRHSSAADSSLYVGVDV